MLTLNSASRDEVKAQIIDILEQYKDLEFYFYSNDPELKPHEDPCYVISVEQVIKSNVEFCEKVYDFVYHHEMDLNVAETDLRKLDERVNLLSYLEERALCEEEEA